MTEGSPWFRAANTPDPEAERGQEPYGYGEQPATYGEQAAPYDEHASYAEPPAAYAQQPAAYAYEPEPTAAYEPQPTAAYEPEPTAVYEPIPDPVPDPGPGPGPYAPPRDDETVALRTVEEPPTRPAPVPGPGRAERRRAERARGRRGAATAAPAPERDASRPMSRVEARRAARARKESVGVVASRVVGELFISFGVVMLLFVAYQLWWTNVRAGQEADTAKEQIAEDWAKGRKPDAFEPGQGFAIMYIPKLDVVVPIAEGIDKPKVLDRGMVGHYGEGNLKTAMPQDKQGNFAVAGHRNTHGEPFRYINQLEPGDPIVVETADAYYTYEMANILPQTSPSNVSVIEPVPKGSGFTRPGRYITLTTCTPEFTSTYRMIVWGKMVEERPRSKGKPDALVG
ncbi:class E sortase [Streptomyces sp. NPDC048604]|uniref:class E sortase n=1 Tax=Streptomyces sp. NPDC048604 TaxID=3365578 RepID=UPI00371E5683